MTRFIEVWLKKYPSIQKFEKLLRRGRIAPSTLDAYVTSVKEFCGLIGYDDPESALEYVRQIENKEEWIDGLIETKIPSSRVVDIMKGVKRWFNLNRIDVDWSEVILPSKEAIIEDRAPTKEELRKILSVCNIRDRAIILVAASSGLRVNTLRTLTFGDVNFDYPDVARFLVRKRYVIQGESFMRGRKISRERNFYITFCSPEAKKALLQYKKYREERGEIITDKSPLFTSTWEKGLGKFLPVKYLSVHWNRLLERARLTDKSGRWFIIHFHTLKKFAETQFINAGVTPSYKEFWLGHKPGSYLESSYFRGEEAKHLEEYRKSIPHLSVTEAPSALTPEETEEVRALKMRIEGALELAKKQVEEGGRHIARLKEEIEKLKASKKAEDCQRMVSEEDLATYLAQGWKTVAALPSGKIVIEKT